MTARKIRKAINGIALVPINRGLIQYKLSAVPGIKCNFRTWRTKKPRSCEQQGRGGLLFTGKILSYGRDRLVRRVLCAASLAVGRPHHAESISAIYHSDLGIVVVSGLLCHYQAICQIGMSGNRRTRPVVGFSSQLEYTAGGFVIIPF